MGKKASKENPIPKHERVPGWEKILYGSADIFGGGQAAFLAVMLISYFTDFVGIAPLAAGLVVTLSKVWDAISDPCMGLISQNSKKNKLGRRKPYMILGGVLIPVGLAFLFAPVGDLGLTTPAKITWMVFAYLVYCTISTISQVPYMSMSADISTHHRERNRANTYKLMFDLAAGAIFYLLPNVLFKKVKEGNIKYNNLYLIVIFGFGIAFALPLILAGIFVKERVPFNKQKVHKFKVKEYFDGLKVRSYILHLGMYVTAFMCMDIVSGAAIYYSLYVAGAIGEFTGQPVPSFTVLGKTINMSSGLIIAPMMVAAAIGIIFAMIIKAKRTKQLAYRIGLPLYIIGAILLATFKQGQPAWLIVIYSAIMGLGFAGAQSMPWLIFPDTVEIAYLKLGMKPTANMSGVMTFVRKVGAALAAGIIGIALQAAHYKPSNASGTYLAQPDTVPLAIRIVLAVSASVLLTIGFICSVLYKVNDKKLVRIKYLVGKSIKEGKESLTIAEQVESELLRRELC